MRGEGESNAGESRRLTHCDDGRQRWELVGDAKRAALCATVNESAIAGTRDVGDGRVQRCDQGGPSEK